MKRLCGILMAVACMLATARAQPARPAPKPPPPKAVAIVISGIGGQSWYARNLLDWVNRFGALLTGKCGLKPEHVFVLTEKADAKATPPREKSTLENVRAAFDKAKAVLAPSDQFILFLAGHGQINEPVGKLCLPGRDLASGELADLLDALPTNKMVIINAASGGAEFLKDYLLDNRVILTAAGVETDSTPPFFAEFFLRAYETGRADTLRVGKTRTYGNRDGVISLLEAYCYAAKETASFYHRQYLQADYRPRDARGRPVAVKGDPDIYWLVRGKETRQVWRRIYAGTKHKLVRPAARKVRDKQTGKVVELDPLPKDLDAEPDFEPKFGRFDKHWHNRRILAEHARIDDILNPKKALFLWEPYKFQKLPATAYAGEATYLAGRTVLGRPELIKLKQASAK